jgi:translation initiation factor eIF-2B subunit beta
MQVIIGTSNVMADGGLMAPVGTLAVCMAAKHHSVPVRASIRPAGRTPPLLPSRPLVAQVIVCSAMFKLCPQYLCAYDQDAFNSLGNPAAIADFSDGEPQVAERGLWGLHASHGLYVLVLGCGCSQRAGGLVDKITCLNPLFDYVPPDLVTLFVSNLGGNAPSYVYRLLSEYYHEDDFEI